MMRGQFLSRLWSLASLASLATFAGRTTAVSRTTLGTFLLVGGSLFGGLLGCEAVFGEFRRGNPENCMSNPGACAADEVCSPVSQLCEPSDAGALDLGVDLASPVLATTWRQEASGTNTDLYSVWGVDTSNVWAVGLNGVIRKWDGAAWTAQASTTMNNLIDIWGADIKNVWAVGYSGTILKGDYDPPIRTYPDPRMEMSCERRPRPTPLIIATSTPLRSLCCIFTARSVAGSLRVLGCDKWSLIGYTEGHG